MNMRTIPSLLLAAIFLAGADVAYSQGQADNGSREVKEARREKSSEKTGAEQSGGGGQRSEGNNKTGNVHQNKQLDEIDRQEKERFQPEPKPAPTPSPAPREQKCQKC
jgi:hypothetical protein